MTTTIELDLYSPRWGHSDKYSITLEENTLTVEMSTRKATCQWIPDEDPKWSKDLDQDALNKILNNDSIYPPERLKSLLVRAWRSWVNRELDDTQIKSEFKELEHWINAVTEARPTSDYWKTNF